MSDPSAFESLVQGMVILPEGQTPTADLPWRPHPSFKGVFLKHLVTSKATEGRMSAHLVRIEPGREIGEHRHEGKLELHEVIEGDGVCQADGRTLAYRPGVVALMPAGAPHRITAGDQGLGVLVKFVPALL